MGSATTIQLCHCSARVALDNTQASLTVFQQNCNHGHWNTDKDAETNVWMLRGRGGGGEMNWDIGIDMCHICTYVHMCYMCKIEN